MLKIEIVKNLKKKNLKVEFLDWGIAFRLKDTMFINMDVLKYDKYCKSVLDHEIKHTGKFSGKDLIHDLGTGSLYDNLLFCLKHPKGFWAFVPIRHFRDMWLVDANQIITYCLVTVIIAIFALVI